MRLRRRHLTALFALVLLALAVGPAQAGAADVTVLDRNGKPKGVSFESLTSRFDVDSNYVLRDASGKSRTIAVRGISIARLFEAIDADTTYSGIAVQRGDGSAVTLMQAQVVTNGQPPAIYESGGSLAFVRPSYSSTDANAADNITGLAGITVKQLSLGDFDLAVTATASKQKIKAGQSVTFEAQASGAGAGQGFSYSWTFADGRTGAGAKVTHKFAKRGTYRVLVKATATGGDEYATKVVTIQVGTSKKSNKNQPGGGSNNAAGAPISGAADGGNGSGDTASGGESAPSKEKKTEKTETPDATSDLPVVSGQILSAATEPLTEQNALAARSGQEQKTDPENDSALGTQEAMLLAAVLILLVGLLSEFGVFSALMRWRRELRALA